MAIKCYQKPQRTEQRIFTPTDAGRIFCYAVLDEADLKVFTKRVAPCFPLFQESLDKIREFRSKVLNPLDKVIGTLIKIRNFILEIEKYVLFIPIVGRKVRVITLSVLTLIDESLLKLFEFRSLLDVLDV